MCRKLLQRHWQTPASCILSSALQTGRLLLARADTITIADREPGAPAAPVVEPSVRPLVVGRQARRRRVDTFGPPEEMMTWSAQFSRAFLSWDLF